MSAKGKCKPAATSGCAPEGPRSPSSESHDPCRGADRKSQGAHARLFEYRPTRIQRVLFPLEQHPAGSVGRNLSTLRHSRCRWFGTLVNAGKHSK